MKKFSFAAILLLAALLVMPGLALCQQGAAPAGAQANKFEVALVKTALLMAEQSITAKVGHRAEIKYASLVVEGEKLVLEGVTLTIAYKKAPTTLSIKRMVVSDLEPARDKSASLGLSVVLQEVSGKIKPELAVKAKLAEGKGLLIGFAPLSLSVKSYKAQAVEIVTDEYAYKAASEEDSDFYLDENGTVKIGAGSATGLVCSVGKPGPKAHGTSYQIATFSAKGIVMEDWGKKNMQAAEIVVQAVKGNDGDDHFSIASISLKDLFVDGDFKLEVFNTIKIGDCSVTGLVYSEGKPGPKAHGDSFQVAMFSVKGLMVADKGKKIQVAEAVVKDAKGNDGDGHFSIVSGSLKGFFLEGDLDQDDIKTLKIGDGSVTGLAYSEGKPGPKAHGASFQIAMASVKGLMMEDEGEKMQVAEAVVKDAKGNDGDDHFSIVSGSLKGFFFDEDKEQLRIDEGQAEGIKGGERKNNFSLASIVIKKLDIDVEDHVVCRHLKAMDFKFVEMGKQGPVNGVDLFSLVVAGVDFAKLDDPKSYGIGKIELLKLGVLVEGNQLVTMQRAATTSSVSNNLSKMLMVVEALTVNSKGLPPEAIGFFKQLGKDQLVFNMRIEGSLDYAKQLLDLSTFSITSAQLGDLSYAIKMGGIQVDPKNPMMSAMKMQGTASLIDAKVDYVDRGLVPAIIEMVAKQNKQPPAQFKEMLIAQARGNPKQPKGPAFQALVEEVVKFIQSPGELHIAVHPDKPVKMGDLQKLNEEQVIQLLKVKITAKPAAKM